MLKRPLIRLIQQFKYSPGSHLSLVSELCASLLISSICFQGLMFNHSDSVSSRVSQGTGLIAPAITVKFILSSVYPEVSYKINLILTETPRPICRLAVQSLVEYECTRGRCLGSQSQCSYTNPDLTRGSWHCPIRWISGTFLLPWAGLSCVSSTHRLGRAHPRLIHAWDSPLTDPSGSCSCCCLLSYILARGICDGVQFSGKTPQSWLGCIFVCIDSNWGNLDILPPPKLVIINWF